MYRRKSQLMTPQARIRYERHLVVPLKQYFFYL